MSDEWRDGEGNKKEYNYQSVTTEKNTAINIAMDFPSQKQFGQIAKLCFAEFVGTAFLTAFSCFATMDPNSLLVEKSLAGGFTVTTIILGLGHISGAYVNPIVTLAAMITGVLPLHLVPYYFISQILGGILGTALFLRLIPAALMTSDICVPLPSVTVTPLQAVFIEMAIASMLVLGCCATWDPRNAMNTDSNPVKFGILVTMVKLTAFPLTGANMNPATAFGPALLNFWWDYHWVYWVGPLSGALVTSAIYRFIYIPATTNVNIPK